MWPITANKVLCLILFASTLVDFSDNAVLSIFEQKRYKRLTDSQGLYESKDNVVILTHKNFKSEIYGRQKAWLVEFYNTWCGYCQRFAPSWKALAADIKNWQNKVSIGVLDCSNDDNNVICREFEVMGYPTLKYFHENYKEDPKNLGIKVNAGTDVVEHRQSLIDVIIAEQKENRGKIYPDMLPYTGDNVNNIFDSATDEVKYTFLIVQDPSQYLGQEVTMDLNRTKDFLVRYALNNNTELIKNLKVEKFPALYVVSRDNSWELLNKGESLTRDNTKSSIQKFLKSKHIDLPLDTQDNEMFTGKWMDAKVPDMTAFMKEREQEALKERVKKMGDVVFQMDLESALRYSLKREVSSQKEITGEKLEALHNYVNLLIKYFPFGKYGHSFLMEIKELITGKMVVNGKDIFDLVKSAEKEDRQVFSSPQQWLGCKGSSLTYRGYPCGLWKMFHYLTVNAAETEKHPKGANPKVALETMHGYIKNFFGCADCSQHFQDMAKRRNLEKVSSWGESILWLWEAHNEVNERLTGDATEDPEHPKLQFPSKENCPACHNSDNSWNKSEVLRHLKKMYSSINVQYIGSDTKVLHLGLDGSSPSDSSSIFKTIDAIQYLKADSSALRIG